MKDAFSVIAQATDGIGVKLAQEYEVSIGRMYEILGKDNPFPKAKKLIRAIGRHNKEGVRLIKADLDAMFADILGRDEAGHAEPSIQDVHREAFEAVDAMLVAVATLKITGIERLIGTNGNIREWSKAAVDRRRK